MRVLLPIFLVCALTAPLCAQTNIVAGMAGEDTRPTNATEAKTHEAVGRVYSPASALEAKTPDAVSRIMRRFDFEERRFNVEEVPVDWEKIEGPGLPHYVNGRLSNDQARSGQYSFRFDLNGGSLIYRYPFGKIPVRGDAHYRVEAYARTSKLTHARARLTAYFTDLDGNAIRSTIQHSQPVNSPDEWTRLTIEMTAMHENAAFVVIELGLVQPNMLRASTLGDRALFMQDIRGTAWFDDVAVAQVPRVTLSTAAPGNIFAAGVPIDVKVKVNDRFTNDLAAQLLIRNADGQLVYQRSQSLELSATSASSEGERQLSMRLPDLAVGWYDVALAMSSQGDDLGAQHLSVIRLADAGGAVPPDPRFGVVATHLPLETWNSLPDLLPLIGAGRVKLAVWNSQSDVVQNEEFNFADLLEELRRKGILTTACLIGLPPSVAAGVGGDSWANLLKAPPDKWQPQLAYMIARHANHLQRWQIGEDNSEAFVTTPAMREVYAKLHSEFTELVQNPDLAVPWPAWYELEQSTPRSVALSLPASVLPSQVPLYVASMSGAAGSDVRLSLSLQLLDRAKYGREMQIRDFAQRFAYATAAGAQRIDVPAPFEAVKSGSITTEQPQELAMILRTLTMMLGNATFRGTVPIAENIEAFLFDRNGQGVLMLWNKGSEAAVQDLAINLGRRPMQVDLWGNVTPLMSGDRRRQSAKLQIGPMPIFLVDIDGEMAQLRTSVSWDNPRVESSFKPHVRKLRFTNPYRTAISGTIRLRGPAGWLLSPPAQVFSLNPGEVFSQDISIEFPYNTYSGAKPVQVEFTLQGVGNTGADLSFAVPVPLHLGLGDIGLQTIAVRDGSDVIVQQMITNYGDKPINYSAFAIFPGHARQERLVTNLGPGRSTVKKYRFADVKMNSTVAVRSGMKELEGTRILNDEVEVR